MTHTNEFLRGMFSAYMGCEVRTNNILLDVIGIDFKYGELNLAKSGIISMQDCKPILTPLSEITDNDAVEVAKIDDKNCDYKFGNNRNFKPDQYKPIWNGSTFFVERLYKGKYVCGDPIALIPSLLNIEQIDYLRSPYRPDGTPKPIYDLGYMHIPSLIAADLAISSKTN